jgi:hypothetical protein
MSLEYVTGTEFILANDSILIFVLNTDQLTGSAHILIYQNNVGGQVLFADTGVMTVAPTGTAIVRWRVAADRRILRAQDLCEFE